MEKFPGHIACDGASKSEIVVPILKDGKVCRNSRAEEDEMCGLISAGCCYHRCGLCGV